MLHDTGRGSVVRVALCLASLFLLALSFVPGRAMGAGAGSKPGPAERQTSKSRASESKTQAEEPRGSDGDSAAGSGSSAAVGAIPASRRANNLAVLTIEGEINAVTAKSFERRLKQAVGAGADGIVVEIDTPGGELGAVFDICNAIKQSPVPNTIAWINPNAYSGGAIIALACKEIVVSPHATMGDAAPIMGDPLGIGLMKGLRPTERAKILSPLLAEVVDSARENGYDEKLVQAFVTLGVELWLVEDKTTGKRYCIDAAEHRTIFGAAPSQGTALIASGGSSGGSPAFGADFAPDEAPEDHFGTGDPADAPGGAGAAAPGGDDHAFIPASGAIDPGTARQVSQALASPSRRPVFSAADRDRLTVLGYVTDGRTLLTMKEREIKYLGFARTTIKDDDELKAYVGALNLRRLNQSWSEDMVAFMTQGMSGLITRGLLIVVFLLAMFIELSVPGVGIAGVVALLALGGLIVPPMLIGAANWWAGAAILLGLVLLLLEIFVLPGVGVAGIAGLLLMMVGLIGIFAESGELFPGQKSGGGGDLAWAGSVVLLAVFVAGVGMYLFSRYTHRFPLAGRLVLADRQPSGESSIGMLEAMSAARAEGAVKVGATGRAATPLRPAGTAEIDDRLVDVVAEFGFINAGEPIRVVSVSPYRVGVERVPAAGEPPGGGPAAPPEARA